MPGPWPPTRTMLRAATRRLAALRGPATDMTGTCLLYTSDAADERSSVDLGGRRIIKTNKNVNNEA